MPSIQINSALVTLTTNGSTTGYITVADNGPIFPNAKGWLTDGTKSQYCIVTELVGQTQIGLRFISSTGSANNNYGRNDCSSYLTGSTFNQELQTCEVEEPLSIKDGSPGGIVTQLIAGSNITLSPTSGIGPVTVSATGGGGASTLVHSGTGISVDNTDPVNPTVANTGVLSVNGLTGAVLINGVVYADSVNTTGTKLSGVASASFTAGDIAFCATVGDFFALRLSALTVDNLTVVAASGKAGYQWVRLGLPNRLNWAVTTWFVSPATGSDENAGTTSGAPLKTFAELYRRTVRAQISANVTITLLDDAPDGDDVVTDFDPADGAPVATVVTLQGTATVATTQTVTSVQARTAATNLANEITVTGFDFSPYLGSLLRVQGTNNYAAITKAPSLGVARLSELINTSSFAVASSTGVTAGQVVEVMTFTKGPLRKYNLGLAPCAAQDIRLDGTGAVLWRDTRLTNPYITRRVVFGGTTSGNFNTFDGNGGLTVCCFKRALSFLVTQSMNLIGCAFTNINGQARFGWNCGKTIMFSCVSQGVTLQIATGPLRVTNDLGHFDLPAATTGLDIPFDSINGNAKFTTGRHYGSGNNATAAFWAVTPLSSIAYLAAQPPTCDAGNGVLLNGVATPIASLPVAFNTATGTGIYAL